MVPEVELRFRKDFPTLKTHEDRRSPPKGFYPMESAPPISSLFGSPDFGGFSQILEKHMREIKVEPSATVTHEIDLSNREKVSLTSCKISDQFLTYSPFISAPQSP